MRVALVLAAALTAAACSSISGTLPAPEPVEAPLFFRAGAARVDLTPPPGYPMGGFSGIGKVGRGVWTRLYARAIHVQAPDGESLAIVACDLWGMSAGLADRVAERLGEDPRTRHIGRDQLVIAATHTHHSPANYSSSAAYNALASPKPGFDRALFEHYAERIHHAISLACARSVSASVRFGAVDVPRLAKNRSLPAFRENPGAAEFIAANTHLPVGEVTDLYPEPDCYRAVDASVSVLRLDSTGTGDTIAVMAFAALHPTVLGPEADVYSSDLFGVASLLLERASGRREDQGEPVTVYALFNGAEGDVSADWNEQGRAETTRLGAVLAAGIGDAEDLAASAPRAPTTISHRFGVVPLAGRAFVCEGDSVRTASVAAIGVPALGGAEDGRTPEHAKGYVEGVVGCGPRGHATKKPAFDLQLSPCINPFPVTRLIDALVPPPDEVPLGVYTIGGVTLATVPGEATTMTGQRIRESIDRAPTLIVGLANEYLSYWTTPEEYLVQHYEGASTLWGQYAGALLAYELGRIARSAPGGHEFSLPLPRDFDYAAGFGRTFGMGHVKSLSDAPDDGLAPLGVYDSGVVEFAWDDIVPAIGGDTPHLTPSVSVEVFDGVDSWEPLLVDGAIEDDIGVRVVTVTTGTGGDKSSWRTWWTPPVGIAVAQPLRIHVRRCDGTIVHSEPFRVAR